MIAINFIESTKIILKNSKKNEKRGFCKTPAASNVLNELYTYLQGTYHIFVRLSQYPKRV